MIKQLTVEGYQSITEEWRPVVGYEGWYEVSNLGRVRRMRPSRNTHVGRVLVQSLRRKGSYRVVSLSKENEVHSRFVHCLVAEAFLGPRPQEKQANHKNARKHDNRAANLEWVTPKENSEHAVSLGLYPRGEQSYLHKLTEDDVQEIRFHSSEVPAPVLGRRFGVTPEAIYSIRNGKNWKHVLC